MSSARIIFSTFYNIMACMMLFLLIADLILVYYTKKHYPGLDNPYFNLHRKYGFVKCTIVKLLAAFSVINAFWISPSGKEIYFAVVIIWFGYQIFQLSVAVIRSR